MFDRGALAALIATMVVAACGQSTPLTSAVPAADASGGATGVFAGWKATPAMISNVGVYRGHEFVYQDYIHDDHGANTDGLDHVDLPFGVAGPDPANPTDPRLSPAPIINYAGDFLYAAPGNHMDDVADLLEFRVAADATDVHYLFRLADMTAPDSSVIAMCVDEDLDVSNGIETWPFGAGLTEQLGCEHIYTIYGTGAKILDVAGNMKDLADVGGRIAVDQNEGLIDLSVPRSFADPGTKTWRYFVASGLWDSASSAWVVPTPIPQVLGAPIITGGRIGVPNIWDLLSNNHEPNSPWNEEKQANDLTNQNILDDYVDVDFARLASDENDPDPEIAGVSERIYRSQYPTTTGKGTDVVSSVGTHFQYEGPWQPYVLVLPHDYYTNAQKNFPFDLCMHPLGANHNVEVYYAEALSKPDYDPLVTGVFPSTGYFGFGAITALVDRLDAVYACTLGRGEGLGYQGGDGLVDLLEVQADVLGKYRVDLDKRTIHGVSLGALGTWYVARMYPDRYAAAMPYIFTSDLMGGMNAEPTLLNLYNLPVFYSVGTLDEFGQGTQGDAEADQLEGFGDEYLFLHYLGRQHEGRIEQDYLPFTNALAYSRTLVRDPARVRFRFDPAKYSEKIPGDGSAYWVSGMTIRDPSAAGGAAEIDVTSLARAGELPKQQVIFEGYYLNTAKDYIARMRGLFRKSPDDFAAMWHPESWEPGWQQLSLSVTPSNLDVPDVANGFTLSATNLGAAKLDAARMKIDPGASISYHVHTDGPLELDVGGKHLSLPAAGDFDGSL